LGWETRRLRQSNSNHSRDGIELCLEDHYTRSSITVTDKSQFKRQSKTPQPVINPNATAGSITGWLHKWRNPPVPSTDKRRLEFITIKADATVYDFDKIEGSFTGKTTVEQLKEILDKVAAALQAQDDHIRIVSKLSEIDEGHKKRKQAAMDAASKKKTRK
jgi:hypothetical protein